MKMKRSEKLGMFTGLVVGVLLLLISVFMIFQTTCKVWGAEKPANATQQGIDVSSHQGKIDWEQVKNSALADYAIIRCGYGVNQTDKDDKYWDYVTAAGLKDDTLRDDHPMWIWCKSNR